jgi:Rod binding domain-containing protein
MGDQARIDLPIMDYRLRITDLRSRNTEQHKEVAIEEREKVAREFESFMIFAMIKELEKTAHYSKKGHMEETYMGLVNEKLAEVLAKKGVGIKELLIKYMDRGDTKVLEKKGDNSSKQTGGAP